MKKGKDRMFTNPESMLFSEKDCLTQKKYTTLIVGISIITTLSLITHTYIHIGYVFTSN